MAVQSGRLVEVGVAPESPRGTFATPTHWMPKMGLTLQEQATKIEDESSMGRIETPMGADVIKQWSEGDMNGIIRTESVGVPLYALFGSLSTSSDDPEAGAHTHTCTVNNTNTCTSLTAVLKDKVVTRAMTRLMMKSFAIEAGVDDYIKMTLGMVGGMAWDGSGTPSYTAESKFRPQDVEVEFAASVAALGAAETGVTSLNFTMTKNAEPWWDLGTILPAEVYNKDCLIEGSMTRIFDGITWRNYALTNHATDVLSIKLNHADDKIGATATAPSLDFQLMGCFFREWVQDRPNADMVIQTIAFKGFYSITESGMIQTILVNGTSSY